MFQSVGCHFTCTSMYASEHWSERNDTLSCCQVWSNTLYKYVCLREYVRMECYNKFRLCVVKSLVQESLPESICQKVTVHLISAKFDQITCPSMYALVHRRERNYTLSSWQVWSNHLYKYVCLRALVRMKWYIKFLPSVIESRVKYDFLRA